MMQAIDWNEKTQHWPARRAVLARWGDGAEQWRCVRHFQQHNKAMNASVTQATVLTVLTVLDGQDARIVGCVDCQE